MAPHTDSSGVEFRRVEQQKGAKLHNDQVRAIGTTQRRRPHSYFRRPSLDDEEALAAVHGGGAEDGGEDEEVAEGFGDAFDDAADAGDDDGVGIAAGGAAGVSAALPLPLPERVLDLPPSPGIHQGAAAPLGYHSSGFPIYGNLADLGGASDDGGGEANGGAVYGNVGAGAGGATVRGNTVIMFEAPGGASGGTSTEETTGMQFSEEGIYDNPLEKAGRQDMGEDDGNSWSTDQYNPGIATAQSPQKKAELAAVSAIYKMAVDEGKTEVQPPPTPPKDPFGKPLAVSDDRDAPHPDALSDPDYMQPCLNCKTCPGFLLHRWRKMCLNCRCPRTKHRSREITQRR